MQKYCLALDLKDDATLIAEYERYHEKIPDAIEKSIHDAGVTNLEIYRTGNRMFMILEADDTFSFEKKGKMDTQNPDVQAWETLMWQFQQALPNAKEGEKWLIMDKVFCL